MGYHVSILRTVKGEHSEISLEKVKVVATNIEGWEYHNDKDHTFTFSKNGKEVVSLWHSDGELWTKNPDEDAIECMVLLAAQLDARVRGDENETYKSATEAYAHPDDAVHVNKHNAESKKRERNSKIRHYLYRTYQISISSFLAYMAIKWFIKNIWLA